MDESGILFAWRLEQDAATPLAGQDVARWRPGDGVLWVHLDRKHPAVRDWLRSETELEPVIVDALLEEETRPRMMPHAGGLLVNLRGVNLNPGADPEDMVSVRMWVDRERVISMRGKPLMATDDIATALAAGRGPRTSGNVLVAMTNALLARMQPVVDGIEDAFDAFEEAITDETTPDPSAARISAVRRRAIELRRYLAPQREVLTRLAETGEPILSSDDKVQLRQAADRVTRLVEDLDVARERGAVTHEEVSERISLRINRNMYLLSIVAVVFLPLSFITGLLGINVGGIPGAGTGWAFLAVCVGLAVVLLGEIWFLRKRHWLD